MEYFCYIGFVVSFEDELILWECEVLGLIGCGLCNLDVVQDFDLVESMVVSYIKLIYCKFGIFFCVEVVWYVM